MRRGSSVDDVTTATLQNAFVENKMGEIRRTSSVDGRQLRRSIVGAGRASPLLRTSVELGTMNPLNLTTDGDGDTLPHHVSPMVAAAKPKQTPPPPMSPLMSSSSSSAPPPAHLAGLAMYGTALRSTITSQHSKGMRRPSKAAIADAAGPKHRNEFVPMQSMRTANGHV